MPSSSSSSTSSDDRTDRDLVDDPNADGQPLIGKPKKTKHRHNTVETMWAIWLILVLVLVLLFAIVLVSLVFLSMRISDLNIRVVEETPESLPRKYSIPEQRVVIPKDQAQRGTCWIFSTIGILESSYRANGYANGYLAEDEYVRFSEQACLHPSH